MIYEPLILSTQELLNRYWPYAEVLFAESVRRTAADEMDVSHIYQLALAGQATIFVVKADTPDGPYVKLALALQMEFYPKKSGLNIFAIGGSELTLLHKTYWQKLCGWAYMNGARFIDADVSPAMARIIRRMGFRSKHISMRFDLTET